MDHQVINLDNNNMEDKIINSKIIKIIWNNSQWDLIMAASLVEVDTKEADIKIDLKINLNEFII